MTKHAATNGNVGAVGQEQDTDASIRAKTSREQLLACHQAVQLMALAPMPRLCTLSTMRQ
jgi:hypothetical protein